MSFPGDFVPISEKFVKAGLEPEYIAFSDKFNLASFTSQDIPLDYFREDPTRVIIFEGKEKVEFDGTVKDIRVAVDDGEITVRCYIPKNAMNEPEPRPAYIDFHGGGYVLGCLENDDNYCKRVCNETGAVSFNVDYRLAPEFPFPAGIEDSWAAVKYIIDHAEELKVDKSKIAIGGYSAGAVFTGVMCHRARDAGIKICLQVLGVPCCDTRSITPDGTRVEPDCPYQSWKDNRDNPDLSFRMISWFQSQYLGNPRPAEFDNNPEVNMILYSNFKDIAPAIVITAQFDVFRDEGELYAHKLQENGVDCTLVRMPGAVHSHMEFDGVLGSGKKYNELSIGAMKAAFRKAGYAIC
ncbi:unnamed protein product [Kuraishia capsulata CBS 1993]|uniref:Alpha/beta hydrolase fold-3 domain-containing protein n=1 Tax=Kuraishia capsulata CBS 1993 TaxID=1382522 RepID=W6MI91_9ASCO|nr:uncharacterized protein KUCA_T00000002001 [Kuraishia capsulata CBS 1993]CDK24042.1 unnamed protein product [Kuraishia capsulata CBS 1993]